MVNVVSSRVKGASVPILTTEWHTTEPSELEISQEYLPTASRLSLLRICSALEESVVFTLYLYDAQTGLPSLVQLTWILWLPANVHSSVSGRPTL